MCSVLWKKRDKWMLYILGTDLSKVFDYVDHDLLIDKLCTLGVVCPLLSWFVSFLMGMTRLTRLTR